jgi:hypothetical protein
LSAAGQVSGSNQYFFGHGPPRNSDKFQRLKEFHGFDPRLTTRGALGTGTAIALDMTHRNVETLIGRLVTDSRFRRRFFENPRRVLAEFREQGFELTTVENEALAGMDTVAMKAFAEAVDRRIQRVELPQDPTSDQRED